MFHSRQFNNKINKFQERALRVAYKDIESSYSEQLWKDCAMTAHNKNLRLYITEMYKMKNYLRPFMQEIFCNNERYFNFRHNNELLQPRV